MAIPAESGGIPDPALLEEAILQAREAGGNPGILLLTIPDNPTGTVATESSVEELCRIARKYDLAIISDEIYGEVVHDAQRPAPPAISKSGRLSPLDCPSRSHLAGGA
ncbi:aspartate aminotransferase [Arthrobacter sp. Hiyo6]|nr:aspartate aminotransferase [Arthrobacter sp. Hiyo6]